MMLKKANFKILHQRKTCRLKLNKFLFVSNDLRRYGWIGHYNPGIN